MVVANAFLSLSELVNRQTGGNSGSPQNLNFFKVNPSSPAAGKDVTGWYDTGCPTEGVAPTTVAVPTNSTNGSFKHTDPGGGRRLFVTSFSAQFRSGGRVSLHDRILHIGGLSGTSTSAQTVGGTLTRYTTGEGNEIWIEIDTQIGATARTVTASYTNQAGTASRTTQAIAIGGTGDREAFRMIPLPLQTADTGVQAVASVTLSASTGTAGAFNVVVTHPIVAVATNPRASGDLTPAYVIPSDREVKTGACLFMTYVSGLTSSGYLEGHLQMVEHS